MCLFYELQQFLFLIGSLKILLLFSNPLRAPTGNDEGHSIANEDENHNPNLAMAMRNQRTGTNPVGIS